MNHEMKDDEILRRYLLGGLEEEQEDEIEERLLKEGDLFELAEAVEGDLLAAAVRGELSPAERGRVLRRLASTPEGRTRLALARGLTSLSRERAPAEVVAFRLLARPGARAAAVAASLVLAAGAFWLASQTVTMPHQPADNMIARGLPMEPAPQAPDARPSPVPPQQERIAGQTPAPTPASGQKGTARGAAVQPEPAPFLLQLALTTVRSAGSNIPRLEIPPDVKEVEIRLPLTPDEPSTSFAAILRDASTQEEIRRKERIAAREVDGRRVIIFSVPSIELHPGLYEVEVRGTGPDGDELLGRPMFEIAST
jgi:hypothetical protein